MECGRPLLVLALPPVMLVPLTSHLQETVELLQAKVSALDLAVLDQVEARLQV